MKRFHIISFWAVEESDDKCGEKIDMFFDCIEAVECYREMLLDVYKEVFLTYTEY